MHIKYIHSFSQKLTFQKYILLLFYSAKQKKKQKIYFLYVNLFENECIYIYIHICTLKNLVFAFDYAT